MTSGFWLRVGERDHLEGGDGTGGKWVLMGSSSPIFGSYPYPPNFHFKNVYEYILIFAKPSGVMKRPVQDYEQLMALESNARTNGVHAKKETNESNGKGRHKKSLR